LRRLVLIRVSLDRILMFTLVVVRHGLVSISC
jgi:hypothetical protein